MGSHTRIIMIAGLSLMLLLPPVSYWFMFGRAPELTIDEARGLLVKKDSPWRLVDVRENDEFMAGHILGAESWPWSEIRGIQRRDQVPSFYQRGRLLLLCQGGMRSAAAVLRLEKLGVPDLYNVRGGMNRWISRRCAPGEPFCSIADLSGESPFHFRGIPLLEQWIISLTAFLVKPLYMVLSFILAYILFKKKDEDLLVLGFSMAAFFIGEAFCAVNFLFFGEDSLMLEFLHSSGMMASFALFFLFIMIFLDRRVLHIEEAARPCVFLPLCRGCWKQAAPSCTAVKLSLFLLPAAAVLGAIPLTAPFIQVAYNTDILGTWYTFTQPMPYQMYEALFLPAASIILFLCAWLLLLLRGIRAAGPARALASLGAGALSFGLFRLALLALYRESMSWYGIWEEITEFLFIAGLALALYYLRNGLSLGLKGGASHE